MKNIKNIVLILTFQLAVFPFYSLGAGVPLRINFQGKLEESGQPATGVKSFVFKIYDALTDGNLIWTSQTESVTVTNGIFSVILQTGTPVNLSTATFSGARYIEISVNGTPLSPMEEIVPSPYSMVAQSLSADAEVDWNALINVPAGLDDWTSSGNNIYNNSGNVGIGTTGPEQKLTVSGNISQTGVIISSGTGNNYFAGNVGIGTTNQNFKISIRGKYIKFDSGAESEASILFFDDATPTGILGSVSSPGTLTTTSVPGDIVLRSDIANVLFAISSSEKMRISNSGNVGIGTTDPTAKLDITGDGSTVLLPRKNAAGDPTGSNGMIYYNSTDGKFRCYQAGAWTDCVGAGIADNMGNHTATTQLKMGNYAIWSSSDITAARYQINGSSVLAILPGTGSLGVGVDAGRINSADYNTFLGYRAGYNNTTGSYNTFLGYDAGNSNTIGSQNTFVGQGAGGFNSIASNNTFIGQGAGNNNTTGSVNTFLGTSAGYYNQKGSGDSIFGYRAGGAGAGAPNSFSSSTIMGYQAGYSLTTGNDNIFIGWQAGYNVTSGTGNIIIGYNQQTPAATTNNFLNIGGTIYGNLSTGNVGIGTTQPTHKLHVEGNAIVSSSMSVSGSGLSGTTPVFQVIGGTMTVLANGKVGIGTINPVLPLQVQTLGPYNKPALGAADSSSAWVYLLSDNANGNAVSWDNNNDLRFGVESGIGSGDWTEKARITSFGNVGIGTAGPTAKLHVTGSGGTVLKVEDTTSYSALLAKGVNEAEIEMEATGSASGQRVYRWRSGDNVLKAQLFNDAHTVTLVDNILVLNSNGNVGIGTAGPTAKLDINGDVFRVEISSTITTADSSGNTGDIRWDANYIYICVSPNTWKRSSLSTW